MADANPMPEPDPDDHDRVFEKAGLLTPNALRVAVTLSTTEPAASGIAT